MDTETATGENNSDQVTFEEEATPREEVAEQGTEEENKTDEVRNDYTNHGNDNEEDAQNDEGIEEGEPDIKDESKKDDTYSSPDDSLIENVESFTSLDEPKATSTITVQLVSTPPIIKLPESQQPSQSPNTISSSKASTSGKRKSNEFKPTVVKPFNFSLNKRVEDRQKYNEKVHKMQKAQEERERLERERMEKEEEELMKLERKKTIPKANPIRHYKPISITPSKKPLTIPDGPSLCLENRNRAKVADKYESPPRAGNKLKQVL